MVAIIDYGVGNVLNVQNAFVYIGEQAVITSNTADLEKADRLLLPGVGAFCDASMLLHQNELAQTVCRLAYSGRPILGICLGMQLLLDGSDEGDSWTNGLGLIPGTINYMRSDGLKVPHMGWNQVHCRNENPLLQGLNGENFYFVHSFCRQSASDEYVIGVTNYGQDFASVVQHKNVYGTQFHPEKSSDAGLQLLRNFLLIS